MKRIIILALLLVLIYIFSINKTFIKDYYKVTNGDTISKIYIPRFLFFEEEENNNIVLSTLKTKESLEKDINEYLNSLQSCYGNKYYYDNIENISILNYSLETKYNFLNKINITYEVGNVCQDEYTLDKDWFYNFKRYANIINKKIYYYHEENNSLINNYINISNIEDIMSMINTSKRIENDKIYNEPENDKYYLEIIYKIDNVEEKMIINEYDGKLLVTIKDEYEKYAIYEKDNVNNYLKELYKANE